MLVVEPSRTSSVSLNSLLNAINRLVPPLVRCTCFRWHGCQLFSAGVAVGVTDNTSWCGQVARSFCSACASNCHCWYAVPTMIFRYKCVPSATAVIPAPSAVLVVSCRMLRNIFIDFNSLLNTIRYSSTQQFRFTPVWADIFCFSWCCSYTGASHRV